MAVSITILSAASHARADAKSQALEEMTRAQDALDRGDVDEAISRFSKAHDLQPTSSGPYLGLGLANARAGRCDAAMPALEEYLKRKKQNPKPEAQAAIDECKRRLAVKPPARIIVLSEPSGAEVRIDDPAGPPAGTTPYETNLPDGHHRVFVSKQGFQSGVRDIDSSAGATEKVSVGLTEMAPPPRPPVLVPPPRPAEVHPTAPAAAAETGTLVVDVSPGGSLSVNGIAVSETTRHYEGKFQRGVYNVLVEKDGFRSVTFTASLEPGAKVTRSVKLSPLRSGAWLGLAIPMSILAVGSGIAALVTFYNADGHPPGSDFDTNATANAAMQGIFYPSLALAATGYLLYGLLNRGKMSDGPPLQWSVAPTRSGGVAGLSVRF